MIRLAIAGAAGRMGSCVLKRAWDDDRFVVAAALTRSEEGGRGSLLSGDGQPVMFQASLDRAADVLIDFTLPEGTLAWLSVCRRRNLPMVIGTTGHDVDQESVIREAARDSPIAVVPNGSIGVHVLVNTVRRIAQELGPQYDVEIVETHHRDKRDAPSGTARSLLRALEGVMQTRSSESTVYGRVGEMGERPTGQIGVHSVRMGDVVGQHEIHFSGLGETITLRHTAHSRDTFAAGVLRAAAWIVGQRPAFYTMSDVVS